MQDAINNKYYVLKTRTCQGILLIDYLYNIKLSLAPHSSLSKYASLELAQQADRIVL
jgi:hypothetical protein